MNKEHVYRERSDIRPALRYEPKPASARYAVQRSRAARKSANRYRLIDERNAANREAIATQIDFIDRELSWVSSDQVLDTLESSREALVQSYYQLAGPWDTLATR